MLRTIILFSSLLMAFANNVCAQQLSLGNAPARLTKSAVLELSAENQGLLLPRLTDTIAINNLNPPDGMVIFFVPTKELMIRGNNSWSSLVMAGSLANYWSVNGNTLGSQSWLGTTDNYALPFITNNLERMRLTSAGRLGVGTTTPGSVLHVFGTNPLSLTGVQAGTTSNSDSILSINNGLVQKLPIGSFQAPISGTGFVKAAGTALSYDNNSYTVANPSITAGTKTKITYDSKGLVTSGTDASTTDIAEGTNLYFNEGRVRSTLLSGLSTSVSSPVTGTDNLLNGIGKLQGQINTLNNAGFLTGNQTITLSGDVTGSGTTAISTTIRNSAVTYAKMQNVSATNRLLGRASTGAGLVEEITIGSGLSLSGTTLSVNPSTQWNTTGNSGTTWNNNFLGTTDASGWRLRTNNQQRMVVDSIGRMGIGLPDPTTVLSLRDTLEIRRTGAVSALLFSQTAGTGDFRIGADGGDIFWQGGGNRNLQMGAFWGIVLQGDRQTASFPGFSPGTTGINVSIPSARASNIPLMIQGVGTQGANLTEWRNASNAAMSVVNPSGFLGIGTSNPTSLLHVFGTNPLRLNGVQVGGMTTADSVLTIRNGVVQKLPVGSFASSNNLWSTTGNAGTGWATNFIGTTDNNGFRVRTNNTHRMVIDSLGNVGIGTAPAFDALSPEKLLVDAGSSTYTPILATGDYNGYFQVNVQNNNGGTRASSDLVATANNGTETTNFVNLGINGSGYVYQNGSPIETGKANDGYLLSAGQDLYIVNNNAAKDIIVLTGGTASTNESMRVTASGRVGIGTSAPATGTKLDVNGAVKLGAKGTTISNVMAFEGTITNGTTITAGNFADFTYTLPTTNTLAAAKGVVSVSPAFDLPSGLSIAFARVISTTQLKIRIQNINSTTAQTINGGSKLYISVVDF
ncbi:hypothetical protein [Cnuella takakiae]|nr:hypothetical protein [Cnuella takakiae]OLY93051.1 hypothetical protein BUE76_14970 [Cnuella takakiae]